MGAVAMLGADCVIVTDDNPRDEVPAQIAADIMAGINRSQGVRYIANRQLAICTALSEASKDDMVLIAGKGHENYQEMGGVRVPFSDITAVLEC
jgi:UDP-N-acetylmuramoyl-L-alanyl-D-glutamate--2,6-diaminopimelate ligase